MKAIDCQLQNGSYRLILDGRQHPQHEQRLIIETTHTIHVWVPFGEHLEPITMKGPVTLARLLHSIDQFYEEHGGKETFRDMVGTNLVKRLEPLPEKPHHYHLILEDAPKKRSK